ncbi:MAG TPA: hypothetical protein DEB39_15460 [Planctomycetaceae bacterium]|nr:hypothetical protein [Planctomycetaceae bacterium]
MNKAYLTLAAVVKNESHYVREWLAHYRAVGFEKFAVVLNDCTDGTERQIRSLSFADDISIGRTQVKCPQVAVYNELCRERRGKTFWMAFLDADEFLFCPLGRTLPEFLSEYERHGGLMVHNYEFGSSGHVVRPERSATASFRYRAKNDFWMHDQFKCVVKPSAVQWYASPHYAKIDGDLVREDHRAVPDENIYRLCGLQNGEKPICQRIRYNHYFTRSMEDFVTRLHRGGACSKTKHWTCNDFMLRDHRDVLDTEITLYESRVMELLDGRLR